MDLRNSLADLAEQIRETGEVISAAERTSLEHAFRAGFLLCLAKDDCGHGEWLPFLKRACVNERKAQRWMRLAGAGLKYDTVSYLGSISAALAYIDELALPERGDILFVSEIGRSGSDAQEDIRCAWIEADEQHPGHYQIISVNRDSALQTTKPVSAELVRLENSFGCAVWHCLDEMMSIPPSEREFTTMPAEMLERDTFDFLGDLDRPFDCDQGIPRSPQMPASYDHALETLRTCVSSYSLDRAKAAWRAVSALEAKIVGWPKGPQMIPIYSRAANSGEIGILCDAVRLLVKANHPELFAAKPAVRGGEA